MENIIWTNRLITNQEGLNKINKVLQGYKLKSITLNELQ